MQRILIYTIPILSIFVLLIGCATESLKDYESKSPDEESIVSQLIKYENARNSGDVKGCLAVWHDEAKIKHDGNQFSNKAEFESVLVQKMADFPKFEFSQPKVIEISGDEAKVKTAITITADAGGYVWRSGTCWLNLVKENNQWLLMSWEY